MVLTTKNVIFVVISRVIYVFENVTAPFIKIQPNSPAQKSKFAHTVRKLSPDSRVSSVAMVVFFLIRTRCIFDPSSSLIILNLFLKHFELVH